VIGVLRGEHPELGREAVLLGAHYDHLGEVNGVVHPGADDNASGTAVVVGLARTFAAGGHQPRTLVFALFGAEESGLLGSRAHARHPTVPLAQTAAMVNFDMVGRLGSGRVEVSGVDSGDGLRGVVTDAARATHTAVDVHGDPSEPSDQVSFYRAGVPVVFFTTGMHADYHRPTDVADRIDPNGLARVARLAVRTVETLAEGPRHAYREILPDDASGPADSRRPFLGIVADLRGGDGVRLADVLPGHAAERGGLAAGDVIVRVGGHSVEGFDTLRRLIATHRPGDAIEIVSLRNGEDRTAHVTLGARP
jgi:Iap family predicted aminopeptidase